jgi:CspA family cold shock protein
MARSGSTLGTVVRWDGERHAGLVEAPDLPGPCWVDASVVHVHGSEGAELRAGQVVEVEWTESGEGEAPLRATRVTRREDLQTGLGG